MDRSDAHLFEYALRLGDNALILGQRLGAWCGHAPVLEEDIAMANMALDLIGQARLWLSLAGDIEGKSRSEDDLAFLRDEREFKNVLLVERPNGDFGTTIMRQFLFDAFSHFLLEALKNSNDRRFAEIAEKAAKEVHYHLERSSDLVVRLGDGTQESHEYMQNALDDLWRFTGELFIGDTIDEALCAAGIVPPLETIQGQYDEYVNRVFALAKITPPTEVHMQKGGKAGLHTEAMGPLLAEMQFLQRAYPGARW
ncbi:MAG TPA: phenylacetate-CoA oxygenase subunit PaaI [Hellea balneolensis]|uniref:Phenylacetate-CoA oxygenase subunit PaaI n=1 Tax=Hellea balneolensis TaxID=287478 RepID=A0A7C5M0I8_9PROT|nr:phenylacetate-CoA oxygenase subunit PaaI [Hellea balneolensis]